MSTYVAITFHPEKKKWLKATWFDDHFGNHNYGVKFEGEERVYDPRRVELKTKETEKKKWTDGVERIKREDKAKEKGRFVLIGDEGEEK